jgi:hypothetical protein
VLGYSDTNYIYLGGITDSFSGIFNYIKIAKAGGAGTYATPTLTHPYSSLRLAYSNDMLDGKFYVGAMDNLNNDARPAQTMFEINPVNDSVNPITLTGTNGNMDGYAPQIRFFDVQLYKIAGTITRNGSPVQEKVFLIDPSTGKTYNETVSAGDGTYELFTLTSTAQAIGCTNSAGTWSIKSNVTPVEVV